MNLLWDNGYSKVYQGDARHLPLEDGSVNLCVTSPPYWGLRKYSGEQELVWGGEDHEHEWATGPLPSTKNARQGSTETDKHPTLVAIQEKPQAGSFCSCGAHKGSFGLEPTVEMYIEHSMVFLDEVWRVLRDDGVVFWNLGDSYSGSGGPGSQWDSKDALAKKRSFQRYDNPNRVPTSVKAKSLCLIPERFIIAASERGWIVRSRIAWTKPNPMPESVRDRPTDAWESIFMLTKGPKYWWDQEAVREPVMSGSSDIKKMLESKERIGGIHKDLDDHFVKASKYTNIGQKRSVGSPNGRNLRNVWEFPTEPYPEAHFAVFPTEIPRKCILAACPEQICVSCGKARERVVEKGFTNHDSSTQSQTTGWTDCGCNAGWRPGLVLDPFAGSCTTGVVAQQLGRKSILIDLSEEYCRLGIKRLEAIPLPMVGLQDNSGRRHHGETRQQLSFRE
ncbi:MAG: site-specific DNA-methyltransferase [Candidatus Brocadiales bacterium]|nr:site-specific DNA-methyltransferase [Candidatus Bathyanammoxibius sp.]